MRYNNNELKKGVLDMWIAFWTVAIVVFLIIEIANIITTMLS